MDAGWYRNKNNPTEVRYFDGTQWTGEVRTVPAPNPASPSPSSPSSSGAAPAAPVSGLPSQPEPADSSPQQPSAPVFGGAAASYAASAANPESGAPDAGGYGTADPYAQQPVQQSAPPQYSPDGNYYWDGTQWIPTQQLLAAQQQTAYGQYGEQQYGAPQYGEQQYGAPQYGEPISGKPSGKNKTIILIVILAVVLLIVVGCLATVGSRAVSETQKQATVATLQADTNATAKYLETAYTDHGGYPNARLLNSYSPNTAPGNVVHIAYYTVSGYPTGNANEAAAYIMCTANIETGEAVLYDSAKGGLDYSTIPGTPGENACLIPVMSGNLTWNPNDFSMTVVDGIAE